MVFCGRLGPYLWESDGVGMVCSSWMVATFGMVDGLWMKLLSWDSS